MPITPNDLFQHSNKTIGDKVKPICDLIDEDMKRLAEQGYTQFTIQDTQLRWTGAIANKIVELYEKAGWKVKESWGVKNDDYHAFIFSKPTAESYCNK